MPPSIPLQPWQRPQDASYRVVEDETVNTRADDAQSDDAASSGWPASPQTLKRSGLRLCGEAALLVFPVAFIALAVTAWSFDGKATSAGGKKLQRVILFGPTVFPLAFAALGGRSMRNMALWKAERGSTIGLLEKLNGSQSLVSAVWLAFSFKSFNAFSAILLVFWCLSPLGGQSSLRLLWEANSTSTEPHRIYYSNVDADSWLLTAAADQHVHTTSAIMCTSILTAATLKSSSTDNWNHPKIPRLADLEHADQNNEIHNPWTDVNNEGNTRYTSLIGVSVIGLVPQATVVFTIPYEYMYLNCTTRLRAAEDETWEFFRPMINDWDNEVPYTWRRNNAKGTSLDLLFNATSLADSGPSFYQSSFFLVSTRKNAGNYAATSSVFYGTKDVRNVTVYECSLRSMMLEARVECISAACSVHQLRRSLERRDDQTSGIATSVAHGRPWDVVHQPYASKQFFGYFPSMVGPVPRFNNHPIDNYIYGNSSQGYFDAFPLGAHYWHDVPDANVSQRLTEMFNTYWNASRWLESIPVNDPYARESFDRSMGEPWWYLRLNRTDATLTRHTAVYKASIPWIVTLLACSITLFILGITNMVVSLRTTVPDIFGYVSSLTRENPYVDIPQNGTTLNGIGRAKLIENLKVQLADVHKGKDVGRIALMSLDSSKDVAVSRVRKGRQYE